MHLSMTLKIVCIISWNDAAALAMPNGITICLKSSWLVGNAVFLLSAATMPIRLYTFFMSKLVNHCMLLVLLNNSVMSNRNYLLWIVRQFTLL